MNKILVLSILFVTILGLADVSNVVAQDISTIEVAQVDNSKYPEVTLYVRILDTNGNKVNNLTQDQFSIIEDGKPVEVVGFSSSNSLSISTIMLIDVSSSMGNYGKIEGAKEAAVAFVELMRGNDQLALVAFNHEYSLVQDFTSDKDRLQNAIQSLNAYGNTAWYDAVISASTKVEGIQVVRVCFY